MHDDLKKLFRLCGEPYECGCVRLILNGTEFYSYYTGGCSYYKNDVHIWHTLTERIESSIQLEEVLNNVPRDIQEKLLFHLDELTIQEVTVDELCR
jgi:hypothetical protein